MKKKKSEQWWRWLLFVPAALLAFIVGVIIGTLINYIEIRWLDTRFFKFTLDISQIVVGVIALYVSVAVAAMVAPNEKIGAIIYSCLMMVFYGVSLVLSIIGSYVLPNMQVGWVGYATSAVYIITLIVSIINAANGKFDNV